MQLLHKLRSLTVAATVLAVSGCASLIESKTADLADDLSSAVYNNNDLETVATAMPTFIIMVDGFIEGSPDNASLLRTGASLNDAMAANFVTDLERKQRLSDKGRNYAFRAACAQNERYCDVLNQPFDQLEAALDQAGEDDIAYLYTLGVSWLGWLQVNTDDWNAVAQLPRAQAVLERVVELDAGYDYGNAQLYLGGIASLLPPALGGKPDEARAYFERAIELSNGDNLMAKVVYAQLYARLMFDQELHSRLLTEALAADPNVDGLILVNTVAQNMATDLLASEADYF
jgi:tetratricopeptide (TPR) repeat protein